jgi:hypothetical protein
MIFFKKKYIYIIIFISSCSFQSTQIEYLKGILSNLEKNKPVMNWELMWIENEIDLYAVNINEKILFTNGRNIRLLFDGWQLSSIDGVLTDDQTIKISNNNNRLQYLVNERVLTTDICDDWLEIKNDKDNTSYFKQSCIQANTDYFYENIIMLNSNNNIVSLEYNLYPGYPMATLKLK